MKTKKPGSRTMAGKTEKNKDLYHNVQDIPAVSKEAAVFWAYGKRQKPTGAPVLARLFLIQYNRSVVGYGIGPGLSRILK